MGKDLSLLQIMQAFPELTLEDIKPEAREKITVFRAEVKRFGVEIYPKWTVRAERES